MKLIANLLKTSWMRFLLIAIALVIGSGVGSHKSLAERDDHEEAVLLVKRLKTEMGFIQGQKIYYGPSEKRFELTVYGIVEPKEQERLLGLARRASQEQKISGIEIIFYPKEKFEVKTINNKVVSKKRIPQIPLRTEKIN